MTDLKALSLDDLPFDMGQPPEPSAPNGAKGRKCRHPRDRRLHPKALDGGWRCEDCGHVATAESVRRGKNNRKRGKAKELTTLRESGMAVVGGANGPEDGLDDTFAVQHKAYATGRYPGWALRELDHLRVGKSNIRVISEGRVPLLIVSESPGQGRKAHEPLAILTLKELLGLLGRD